VPAAPAARADIVVIGAGPAGATAAGLLASWGWSVLLIDRNRTLGHSLAESLPPGTRKLLGFLGQLDAIDRAGFHPNAGNIAHWAGRADTTTTEVAGFHVSRAAFDEVLRKQARTAGARTLDAVVAGMDRGESARIHCTTPTGPAGSRRTIDARFVLDCSGRAGIVARRGYRRADADRRMLAVVAEWQSEAWTGTDACDRTVVESFRDGWAWSVPLSGTRRQCTVMVDPVRMLARRDRPSRDLSRDDVQRFYTRELAKACALGALLTAAHQTSAPWTCDASLYHAPRPADTGLLLVGDAASFIDPLSSAGVRKALVSAWRAAVVANTVLRSPAMASVAEDFYVRREQEVFDQSLAQSRRFSAEAASVHDNPFWTGRAAGVNSHASSADADVMSDVAVREAFERLRTSGDLLLRRAPALRFEPTADIEGREVVLRDAVAVPGAAPRRFAAGVNLPALARLATGDRELPALIDAYQSTVAPAPIGGLLTGLSWLVAHRALVHEDSRP